MRARTARRLALAATLCVPSLAAHAAPFETGGLDPAEHMEIKMAVSGKTGGSRWSGAAPSVELTYPATEDLELAVKTEHKFLRNESASHSGLGDTEVGAKWRAFAQDRDGHRVGLTLEPHLIAPTGDASRGFGDGAWMLELPAIVGRAAGRWELSAQAGYLHVFGPADDKLTVAGLVTLAASETLEMGVELAADAPATHLGKRHIRANIGFKHHPTRGLEVQTLIGRSLHNHGDARITQFKIALEYALR
jgi:hypothetical protein